jgi:hypothetical protein
MQAMQAYEEVDVYLHSFLKLALQIGVIFTQTPPVHQGKEGRYNWTES